MTNSFQCVEEVKFYVQLFYESAMIPAVDGDIVKSDTRVSDIPLQDVQQTSAALRSDFAENVSQKHSVISNAVDPFLCPFSWEAAKFTPYGWAMPLFDCLQRYIEGSSYDWHTLASTEGPSVQRKRIV